MFRRSISMVFVLGLLPGTAFADASACMMCHGADEFEGMEPEAVQEALADPGIPPHGKFADLTIEEVKALLESLAE
ncbi:MAG: hypothetical protein EP301_11445 [Gammaproteobacteria bacterium]|nr:MAG: hypothetical protein EP301_11445 [Gammaproteobacteria bacterium]